MKLFFFMLILVSLLFTVGVKKEWIIITNKAHKELSKIKSKISNIYQSKKNIIIDKSVDSVDNYKKQTQEPLKKINKNIDKAKNTTNGIFYKIFDVFYEIYHDLFGDPINNKK